jgi:hypothetical protein
MVRQGVYSQEGELTMSLPVGRCRRRQARPAWTWTAGACRRRSSTCWATGLPLRLRGRGRGAGRRVRDGAARRRRDGDGRPRRRGRRDPLNHPRPLQGASQLQISSSDLLEGISDFDHPWLRDDTTCRCGVAAGAPGSARCPRDGRGGSSAGSCGRTSPTSSPRRWCGERRGCPTSSPVWWRRAIRARSCGPGSRTPTRWSTGATGQHLRDREARAAQRVDDDDQ